MPAAGSPSAGGAKPRTGLPIWLGSRYCGAVPCLTFGASHVQEAVTSPVVAFRQRPSSSFVPMCRPALGRQPAPECRGRRAAGARIGATRGRRRLSLPPRSSGIARVGAFADPCGEARRMSELTSCSTAVCQQLWPVACLGGEDAQQLGLAVELGEDVAGGQRQFGFEVSQRSEHVRGSHGARRVARAGARCRRRAPLPCSRSGGRCRRLPE